MKKWLYIICCLLFAGVLPAKIKEGIYRGVLILDEEENIELPFNFEVKYKWRKPVITIKNGEERIKVDEIKIKGDSVFIKMPVFDTEFRCIKKGNDLEGTWINHYRKDKNKIRFFATYNEPKRFLYTPGKANPVFEGKWKTVFSPGTKDSTKALGIFHHEEQTDFLSGTFLTETGDYRFLEGMKNGDKIYLSAFDGSHAFLFVGAIREDKIRGTFYSGSHWKEPWQAERDPDFKLREAEEITTVKPGDVTFSFSDLTGKKISLTDKQFHNKAVIIQVMGSWCPNCMDETRYLQTLYTRFNKEGLEIVALAFEKTNDQAKAKAQVERMVKRLGVTYPVLLTLQSGKAKASETLPFLSSVAAFPTTIYLNKQHQIVKVHTGFSGPATGNAYLSYTESTEALIRKLLKE